MIQKIETMLERVSFLSPLVTRLVVGFIFAQSGWGKLNHLSKTVDFFASLGIPLAQVQAPMIAFIELIGGLLLIAGLYTRIAALPLIGTMVVAILTAKRDEIDSLHALFMLSEFLLALLLGWLATHGPGALSLDSMLRRRK